MRIYNWDANKQFSFTARDVFPGNEYRQADLRDINKFSGTTVQARFEGFETTRYFRSGNRDLNGGFILSDFKDPFTSTYGLKYTAEETGSKSIYIFGIRDIHNRLIGTLGLDYVKRKKALDNTDIQMLEIEAAQIGGVLHKHLYEK
jgi:hypothetical protein